MRLTLKIISLFTLFFSLTLVAQESKTIVSTKYSINRSDFESKISHVDSTAGSIIIYELGESYIEDSKFQLIFKLKRKVKIISSKGIEKTTVVIPLYSNSKQKETIENIKATTYNIENGKITNTQLLDKDIYIDRISKNRTQIKFALPNVKEGSVITYSYQIKSPFLHKFRSWEFQNDTPKKYSEYHTTVPVIYNYNIWLNGDLELTDIETGILERCVEGGAGNYSDCVDTRYIMTNIPPFAVEKYISSSKNYLSRLDYELASVQGFDGSIKVFGRVDKELEARKSFGGQMKKSKGIKNLINEIGVQREDEFEIMKETYRFVQDNYLWNMEYGVFDENNINDLLREKRGNVSEVNILLYNLLKRHGIVCNAVILSSRENGVIDKKKPKNSDFNYVLIKATVNGSDYLLDATDKNLAMGELPFRCLNQHGLLLDFEKGSKWITIEADKMSKRQFDITLNIDAEGSLTGTAISTTSGYYSLEKDAEYKSYGIEKYSKNLIDMNPALEISNIEIRTRDLMGNDEFEEVFFLSLKEETIGENIYLNPFLFKSFDVNPFVQLKRTYPIDFGFKDRYEYKLKIDFGANYQVVEIPKKTSFELPQNSGKAVFDCSIENKIVNLSFKFDFKKPIYESSDYQFIKEYIAQIINVENNSFIVLKKKE